AARNDLDLKPRLLAHELGDAAADRVPASADGAGSPRQTLLRTRVSNDAAQHGDESQHEPEPTSESHRSFRSPRKSSTGAGRILALEPLRSHPDQSDLRAPRVLACVEERREEPRRPGVQGLRGRDVLA